MDQKNLVFAAISIPLLLIFAYYGSFNLLTALGLFLFAFLCFRFIESLGIYITIREIVGILALLQWVVGPVLSYNFGTLWNIYSMAIPEYDYMSFVVPGSFLFVAGLYIPLSRKKHHIIYDIKKIKESINPNIGKVLVILGLLGTIISPFVPGSLSFFAYLICNFRYVGVFYILISDTNNKLLWLALVFGGLLLDSVSEGMFHDLMLWSSFLLMIGAFIYQFSMTKKLIIIGSVLIGAIVIQNIKSDIRSLNHLDNYSKMETFLSLITNRIAEPKIMLDENSTDIIIARINQGWIISRVMNYVPYVTPFENGSTILEGLESALLPRFLAPNKVIAGGKAKFNTYTGQTLNPYTSMNISVLGEGYVNFGILGGITFIFFYGLLLNVFLTYLENKSLSYSELLLWIPFVFLQAIKAETDFATVINHLVKASIVVVIYFKLIKPRLDVKRSSEDNSLAY